MVAITISQQIPHNARTVEAVVVIITITQMSSSHRLVSMSSVSDHHNHSDIILTWLGR